ncbi:MAG TPA: peptidylprolyl isomerase [Actinospica sp.]|nr:peptidylprolyl isomerase [Actinospica sp.]
MSEPQNGQGQQPWANPHQQPQDATPWQQPDQPPTNGQYGPPSQTGQAGQQQWQTPGQYGPPAQPPGSAPQWQSPYQQAGYPQPQGAQPPNYPYPAVPGQQWQSTAPPRKSGSKAAIFAAIGAVVVIGVIAAVVLAGTSHQSAATAVASAQPSTVPTSTVPDTAASSAGASTDAQAGGNALAYEASGASAKPGIGVPTFNAAAAEKDYTVTFQTNRGDIVIDMNGKAAPYTVYSFVYLAEKTYFDNTKCHRLTTSGIYVLQCGDPTGTGSGGPGYTIPDENLASLGTPDSSGTVTYKPGVIAMANTGQAHTGGSQFFLVYKDSPLTPTYTPFGTVTQGLSIIQQVAAAGTDNANGTGDGAPNDPVQIEAVTVR